jgi:hypothetical protein
MRRLVRRPGFVAGETINYFNNKAQREAFLAGYEKGQSNAVKQQYWIARDNQRPSLDDGYEEGYYEITVPQSDRDGVRREPTKRVIRVVMPPKEGRIMKPSFTRSFRCSQRPRLRLRAMGGDRCAQSGAKRHELRRAGRANVEAGDADQPIRCSRFSSTRRSSSAWATWRM